MHDLWATRDGLADESVDVLWTQPRSHLRFSRGNGPIGVLSLWMKRFPAGVAGMSVAGPASLPAVPYRIVAVCLGNICRSPVAEAVLRQRIDAAGLSDAVEVASAGTGEWHVGHDMDRRSRALLDAHGYLHDHTARQIAGSWLTGAAGRDLLLAMDTANYADLTQIVDRAGSGATVRMLRSFDPALEGIADPDARLDVPDPYYGGPADFAAMLALIEPAADGLVAQLPAMLRA